MVIQNLSGLFLRLKEPFDFSFLKDFGEVFKVFDDQDSGNICFGVARGSRKYFVKFAGAPTAEYDGSISGAVERLRAAAQVYEDLRHNNLVSLVTDRDLGSGFALVFEWEEGICLGKQYPGHRRFIKASLSQRMQVFEDILSFHLHAVGRGYVAIDFYDGSILYDFERNRTVICDVDFYQKQPVINKMGRMWGSSRFMSPEELTLGSQVDEISNVFLMGATAFALLGGELDRSIQKWIASQKLHAIALKAVSESRKDRFQTLEAFADAWRTTSSDSPS